MALAIGSATAAREAGVEKAGSRMAWLDNLRVAVIASVIVVHVSATYAVHVPWYYEERTASPETTVILSALFGPGVFYAMAVLFLAAGLLTPRSLERKGTRRFITDRLLRLGVPLVVSTWVLIPLTALVGALAEGSVTPSGVGPFLARAAVEMDTGVMWFVAALLTFSMAYAALRRLHPHRADRLQPMRWWHVAAAVVAIAAGSFIVRVVWPALSVTPAHLNLWDWPSMATLFFLGVFAGERGWLDPVPERLRGACGWLAAASLSAATLFFAAVAVTGDDRLLGGWNVQALVLPAIEGVLAVAASLWLLAWFQRRWTQNGPVARAAARSSYAAYVFHPVVVVVVAAAFRPAPVAGEVKFLVVATVGVVGSFALGWLLTQFRPLRRVL